MTEGIGLFLLEFFEHDRETARGFRTDLDRADRSAFGIVVGNHDAAVIEDFDTRAAFSVATFQDFVVNTFWHGLTQLELELLEHREARIPGTELDRLSSRSARSRCSSSCRPEYLWASSRRRSE